MWMGSFKTFNIKFDVEVGWWWSACRRLLFAWIKVDITWISFDEWGVLVYEDLVIIFPGIQYFPRWLCFLKVSGLLVGLLVKANGFSKLIWRRLEGKCVVISTSFFHWWHGVHKTRWSICKNKYTKKDNRSKWNWKIWKISWDILVEWENNNNIRVQTFSLWCHGSVNMTALEKQKRKRWQNFI